jgi:3-oxoacyl-[acyl-carrier protein] reductase
MSASQETLRGSSSAASPNWARSIYLNNVGKSFGGDLMESDDEEWESTFAINLFQTVRMIRLAVPHMRKRGGGSIVNVASLSGWEVQMAGNGQYGSSKAAIIFLGERFALELARDKIRVNTISPGAITFPGGYWEEVGTKHPESLAAYIRDGLPMGRLGKPEEVADAIVFLASPRANWINGRNIAVDGLQQPVPLDYQRPY